MGWEAGKGVFAIEFTVGYGLELEAMGIPMEQLGFLGQVSAIAGKDYTNYDVFRADIAQHADERTLNDLDVFLRWLWDEILNESELNVYLYYGHCDGMAMEVGLNQMVYRSVDSIVGPQQVHAPTVSLFGVGVGWVYGLDDDCSLKSMGTNLGKGEDFVNLNWEHIFDEDGYKCDELECIGFVRVNSSGKCYFRGGDVERPHDYSSDDRDCYIPDGYSMRSRLLNM